MASAQHARPTPYALVADKAVTQFRYDHWSVREGLSQSTIYAAAQTRDGYLWLGTPEGLVRFDGLRFTTYDPNNVDALGVKNISALLADDDGLWIATRGGGRVHHDGRVFRAFTEADGLTSDITTSLHRGPDGGPGGGLWIGTYGGGLVHHDDGVFTAYGAAEGIPEGLVSAVTHDARGTLWVGTARGLVRRDGARFRPADEPELAGAYVSALFADRAGNLWIATRGGDLFEREATTGALRAHRADVGEINTYIRAITQDQHGNLWFGGYGGLYRFDGTRFDVFAPRHGLVNGDVMSLVEDREGSLWIGTQGGLGRLHNGPFTPFTAQEGLTGNYANTVFEASDGALWIGTNDGLTRRHGDVLESWTTDDGLASNLILSVGEDGDGAIWIGTRDSGLHRLHAGRLDHFTTASGLTGDGIYALYTDADGALWIGTDGGVDRYAEGRFTSFTTDDGLSSPFLTSFEQRRAGGLWIGTYDGGLNLLRDGRITHVTADDGLPVSEILSLYEDADGALWIGTLEDGLVRWKDGVATTYRVRHGLFNDTIAAILEADGALWMSSTRGIFRVQKAELDAFAHGDQDHIRSVAFGVADGLKSVEANGGQQPAAVRARDGALWFPTPAGVVRVHPDDVRPNPLPPTPVIERLVVGNDAVPLGGAVTLPPGSDKIEVVYTGLSLIAPERLRFRYRLDGADDEWFEAGTRREAHYTNLGPGTYTLYVRAGHEGGLWSDEPATLTFTIEPFFYETGWFLLLCGALLAGGAYGSYRLRVRNLEARARHLERTVDERTHALQEEKDRAETARLVIAEQAERLQELDRFKTRFFANVSHEFRTPLTMIIGPLENALAGRFGALVPEAKRNLEIMLRNAHRLLRLINQLLDLSKLEAGKMELRARPRDLVAFLENIVLSVTALAEHKQLDVRFAADRDEHAVFFEPDKLEKVFFNLLSNAIKFTPGGGRIEVTVEGRDAADGMPQGAVVVRVQDTGQGIPEGHLPYVFDRFHQVDGSNTRDHEGTGIGLALVKELILLHGGHVTVESEVGRGTVFEITLPKGKDHLRPDDLADDTSEEDPFAADGLLQLASADFDYAHADEPGPSVEASGFSGDGAVGDAPDTPLVLVIDDNRDVRQYVASILGTAYRIVTAADGEEGLAQVRALRPDLVVSDVMMPRLDGHALCGIIKNDPALDHIPVILLTARATQEMKLEGLAGGADDYMAKPFNADELLARAKNLLLLRRQEQALKAWAEELEARVEAQVAVIVHEREIHTEKLRAEKERAEQSERLKASILDNMNHEFRTPLTAILGYAEVLVQEASSENREFALEIDENGRRLLRTLDALLQLSRLEADAVGARPQQLDLAAEVGPTAAAYQRRAETAGLAFEIALPADGVSPVSADPRAVEAILSHLLDNAVKFTDEGTIRVEVEDAADEVRVHVRDTGIGIEPAFMPALFDVFTQGSSGLSRTHEGCGLGLTIARRLADGAGGRIAVTSVPGAGSTFTVAFPVITQAADAAPEASIRASKKARADASAVPD